MDELSASGRKRGALYTEFTPFLSRKKFAFPGVFFFFSQLVRRRSCRADLPLFFITPISPRPLSSAFHHAPPQRRRHGPERDKHEA